MEIEFNKRLTRRQHLRYEFCKGKKLLILLIVYPDTKLTLEDLGAQDIRPLFLSACKTDSGRK